MSDDGLLAAVAAGDRAARALLFDRYAAAVHRFVARMRGSDPDAVEDLVQLVFIAAFRSAGRFRGGNPRAWLFGIAVHQVRDFARREIRRKRVLEGVAATAPRSVAPDRPHGVEVAAAIAKLPYDLRAAVVLVDLQGERGRDAAAALGIPEGTLWRRVHVARKQLRIALGEP